MRAGGRPSPAWAGILTAAVAMTLALVLLSPDGPDGPDGVRARLLGGEKPAAPMSVGKKPLWDSWQKLRLSRVAGARLHGGTLLMVSRASDEDVPPLVAVNARTGKERWRVGSGPVPGGGGMVVEGAGGVVERSDARRPWNPPLVLADGGGDGDGDWAVLVSYSVPEEQAGGTAEYGVAALSGKDGSLRWKRRLPGETTLLSADDPTRRVMVGVRGGGSADGITSYALDVTREGRTEWRHKGAWAYAFAGEDTVLGEYFGPRGPRDPERAWQPGRVQQNAGGTVFALDARTGRKKWDMKGRSFESTLGGAVDGRAFIRTATEEQAGSYSKRGRGNVVVDTGSGEVIDRPRMFDPECGTDGHRLLACVSSDKGAATLYTLRPGDHDAPVTADAKAIDWDPVTYEVDSVRNGRVHVSFETSSVALDRLGREVGGFRDHVIDSSGRLAVVLSHDQRLSVLPLRPRPSEDE